MSSTTGCSSGGLNGRKSKPEDGGGFTFLIFRTPDGFRVEFRRGLRHRHQSDDLILSYGRTGAPTQENLDSQMDLVVTWLQRHHDDSIRSEDVIWRLNGRGRESAPTRAVHATAHGPR